MFEQNANIVNEKVYGEENDDRFLFPYELDAVNSDGGKSGGNGGHQILHLSIDADLEF